MPKPAADVKPDPQGDEQPIDAADTSDPPRETDLTPKDIPTAGERREQSIASITAARLDMLEEDEVDVSGMGEEEKPEEEKKPPEEDADLSAEDPAKAEEKPKEPAADKKADEEKPKEPVAEEEDPVYEIQVHGETREVSLSKLKENYGLDQAGRQLMTEAAQIYKNAEAYARGIAAQPAAADKAPDEETAPDPLDDLDFEQIVETIQYGEKDEAANALKGLITTLRGIPATGGEPPVNVAEIEQRVLSAVTMKEALSRFDQEYEDILSDPVTSDIALQHTRRGFISAMQDSQTNGTPMLSYWDILDNAGKITRTWLESIKGTTETDEDSEDSQPKPKEKALPAVDISPEKTEAKRASMTPPSQRAPRTPATGDDSTVISFTEEAEQKRRSADIAAIAKGRGQHA